MTVLRPLLASESPDARALSLMGTAEALSGNTEAAVQYPDKAVASSPEDAALRSQLGSVRLAAGNTAAGIADLQQVVAMKPESDGGGDVEPCEITLIVRQLSTCNFDSALGDIRRRQ